MAQQVKAIPDGYHSVTPMIIVNGAARAIDFYKRAFGAVELYRMPGPDGRIMHAEIRIGDSVIMMSDEMPEGGAKGPQPGQAPPVDLMIYCQDADATFNAAVAAGATVRMPINDAFWGDRYGQLTDPFGHVWSVATHVKDVQPDELKRAMDELMAKQKGPSVEK